MKKIIKKVILIFCLLVVFDSISAIEKPSSLSIDPRIKVIPYEKNNVVHLVGTLLVNTQIIFGQHEVIVDVHCGDAAAWTIDVNKYFQNILNIKPTITGSHSDLSVGTIDDQGTRRLYQFDIFSQTNKDVMSETYVLKFSYYGEQNSTKNKVNYLNFDKENILSAYKNPQFYNWDYSFHGQARLKPLHVFDDGKFTYVQWNHYQTIPAIFAVNNTSGEESVINYRKVDDYIVIQELAPQFTLREGKHAVATIFNNHLVNLVKNNN